LRSLAGQRALLLQEFLNDPVELGRLFELGHMPAVIDQYFASLERSLSAGHEEPLHT
jgi:hypothetical protein